MNEDPRKVDDVPEEKDWFRVGVTVFEHDPAKERYRNMLHLVAYDVRDPARLRRVAPGCAPSKKPSKKRLRSCLFVSITTHHLTIPGGAARLNVKRGSFQDF